MDRRNSDDERPPQQPSHNPNVFADDYALDPDEDDFMPSVSDGFRPAAMSRNETWDDDRQDHDRSDPQRPPLPTANPADNDLGGVAPRNSTMKPPFTREATSADPPNPGAYDPRSPSSQATAALQHRESISSNASFATMDQSESAFGVGPSHPYGMYTQNTMARPSSVVTSSTPRQPHRSLSLQRPTHPYALYPQNVIEDESPVPAAPPAIPVGFPGIGTNYHRQIGPDGEEQDIVGPDGHTEQLPPYSRYPEEGPTKAAMAAEASATATPASAPTTTPPNASDDTLPSPVSPIQPPAAQEQETQNRSISPPAAPSAVTTTLSSSEKGGSEKQESTKNATNWRSKKVLGRIPMGVALILLVLVLIFAIILGAAIGTYVAKNKGKDGRNGPDYRHGKDREEPSPQITGAANSLFDATPISTPPSLPPLPTGDYALPLGIAQESSPSCLIAANQLSAWSCKMTFAPLILSINNTDQPGAPPEASLTQEPTPDGILQYGVQPPKLSVQSLQLVLDLDYKAFGPAYHFSDMYDKLVILNQDEFAAGASLTRAALNKRDDKPPFRHRFQVVPGDLPWYCYWNETYIEGYIYVTDDSSAAILTSFPTNWPSNPYGSSVPVETGAPATPASTNAGSTPTPSPVKRRKRGDGDYERKAPYPRIVKIEERRLPGSPQPYCQRMHLSENGTLDEARDEDQNPIIIFLQEDDPSMEEFLQDTGSSGPSPSPPATNSTKRRGADLQKRQDPPGACHCQWMFQ